jgi:hypothetical protein
MQSHTSGRIPPNYNPSGEDLPPSGYQQDQNVHVKDFLNQLEKNMRKQPGDFQKYVKIFAYHMIYTVEDIRLLTETDWCILNFPIGLVNNILKNIAYGP